VTRTCTQSVVARCSSRRHPHSFPAMPRLAAILAAAMRSHGRRACAAAVFAAITLTCGVPAYAQTAAVRVAQAGSVADRFAALIAEAAQRSGIPASWIRAVMQAESAGDARAVSPKGAMGLMQIMPTTWASLRVRYGLGADPFDPHDNILAGAAYLRELMDRYGSPDFIAAYNAGPARYEDHLATGRPLPAETRAYVALVARRIERGSTGEAMVIAAAARTWTEAPLFVARSDGQVAASGASSDSPPIQPSSGRAVGDWTALAPQPGGLFVRTSEPSTQR
jgi:soluble lytic murein transglycosylase-like protein